MNLILNLEIMRDSFKIVHPMLIHQQAQNDEAIETVLAMQEALRDALSQMVMAGDCIEAGRYDEALLHVRSLHRTKRDILRRAEGNEG